MIAFCTYRPAPPASHQAPSIRLRCRDFVFVALNFLTEKDAGAVYNSIKSLSAKLGRIEKLYAFSYVPQPPEKDLNGWDLFDYKKEFARQGVTKEAGWRITNINADYAVCQIRKNLDILLTRVVLSDIPCHSRRSQQHIGQRPEVRRQFQVKSSDTCFDIPPPNKQLHNYAKLTTAGWISR